MTTPRLGLIGDYDPTVRAHIAIPRAIELVAEAVAGGAEVSWLATPTLERDAERNLVSFDGLWCVPNSPYASMDGALRAIRFARERRVPFLGTCGGFQHALIEYSRDVLGLTDADHTESNPTAALPLIVPLACSLVGERGTIMLRSGSRAAAIYGSDAITEGYHCSFGLDPRFHRLLADGALRISGVDSAGEARVVEIADRADHPFFIATLFQPELSAFAGVAHPLIRAFVLAAAANGRAPDTAAVPSTTGAGEGTER